MKSDVPSHAPPPPRREPVLPPHPGARPLVDVRDRSLAELEVDLEDAVRRGKASVALSPGADGTPAIPSLIAVWLLSRVGKALEIRKPVDLSKVDNPADLRSIGGVARLLHEVLHPVPAVAS